MTHRSGPSRRAPMLVSLLLATAPTAAAAQLAELEVDGVRFVGGDPVVVTVDRDDDDDDGAIDSLQARHIPRDDLVELKIRPGRRSGDLKIAAIGGLRLVRDGEPLASPARFSSAEFPLVLSLQATRPSSGSRPASLLLSRGDETQRLAVRAVEVSLLDGNNEPLSAAESALHVSHRITNDLSLPRRNDYHQQSVDVANVRLQVTDDAAPGRRLSADLMSIDPISGAPRHQLTLELTRPHVGLPFRSPFVRLVGDDVDRTAPGVAGQVLQVALRDRVRVLYRSEASQHRQEHRVGRPGREHGPLAARLARVRVVVLRAAKGGQPVIGVDDLSALRIVREEIAIANQIWLQCGITFGPPDAVPVRIEDPPSSGFVAVSDRGGLPAAGGGQVRLDVDGRIIGPIATVSGAPPSETALNIARALMDVGLDAVVTVNPSTVFGAGASADVVVRHKDGALASITAIPGVPLSTDPRQKVSIGRVDLGDGLEEFENMTARSGSLEERTMIKALADQDPTTIDLFIVNRFTHGTRQGEAFIEAGGGPIVNTVVLDRNGLRQRQTAWTMAHELGHVLLNQPLHPDNVGADRPSLLMDSDNSRGTVNGPKRLSPKECQRVRYESGVDAVPALLTAFEPGRGAR